MRDEPTVWSVAGTAFGLRAAGVVVALALLAAPLAAGAQGDGRAEGEGQVILIDVAAGRLGLDHGLIPGLMPAMRMLFAVERAELLDDLHPGDRVRFTLMLRGLEWKITEIVKATE